MSASVWNPEEIIIRHVNKGEVIKIHEGYLPLVLALMCRGLVQIVSHANGLIEISAKEHQNNE